MASLLRPEAAVARFIFTAIILLCAGATALARGPSQIDSYTALMEQICRNYATEQRGMPADLMFQQCMAKRHCRVSSGASGYQCEMPGPMSWHGGGY
jgi:hypothetical protein